MRNTFRGSGARFVAHRGQRGATATEYSLMVFFVSLAIVAGVGAFGIALNGVFAYLAGWLATVI